MGVSVIICRNQTKLILPDDKLITWQKKLMLPVFVMFFLSLLRLDTSGRSDITSTASFIQSFTSGRLRWFGLGWGRLRFMDARTSAAICQTGLVTSIRSLSSTMAGVLGAGPVNVKWTNIIDLIVRCQTSAICYFSEIFPTYEQALVRQVLWWSFYSVLVALVRSVLALVWSVLPPTPPPLLHQQTHHLQSKGIDIKLSRMYWFCIYLCTCTCI